MVATETINGRYQQGLRVTDMHFSSHLEKGATDGVAIEMGEISGQLSRRGWMMRIASARAPEVPGAVRIPGLAHDIKPVQDLRTVMFANGHTIRSREEEAWIHNELDRQREPLGTAFSQLAESTDVYFGRNVASLPINPAATEAWASVVDNHPGTVFVNFSHDHVEQRRRDYTSGYDSVNQRVRKALYPNGPNVFDAVINNRDRRLLEADGRQAIVVFDSQDFSKRAPLRVESKQDVEDIRMVLGNGQIRPNDVVIEAPGRVIRRKVAEAAIQIAAEFDKPENRAKLLGQRVGVHERQFTEDSRFIVLFPQAKNKDPRYFAQLQQYAREQGVKIVYSGDRVVTDAEYLGTPGVIPFSNVHGAVDIGLMTSREEGFGNNLMEMMAHSQLVPGVFGYEVFEEDIEPKLHLHGGGVTKIGSLQAGDYMPIYQLGIPEDESLLLLRPELAKRFVQNHIPLLLNPEQERKLSQVNRTAMSAHFDAAVIGARLDTQLSYMVQQVYPTRVASL